MAKLFNLARMTTSTTGTGTITLGSAVAGFLSFSGAGVADGDVITYAIKDGSNSEIGRGTYTSSGTTLTRTVLKSTNSNAAISLSGTAEVFITAAAEDFNQGPVAGLRNRIINGCMRVNQRAVASATDDTYAFDRWNILTQTASIGVSAATNVENGYPYAMRLTQSQASAQRFGCNQIIEQSNVIDMRGKSVVVSARVRCSATTGIRITILEWTGTGDAVTSDSVLDWTSSTFTTGNFFISTTTTLVGTATRSCTANTATTITAAGTLSSSLNNVVVLITTDSAQAQNVTLDVGKVQLVQRTDTEVEDFEYRPFSFEMAACQRYYYTTTPGSQFCIAQAYTSGAVIAKLFDFPVTMRASPTASVTASSIQPYNSGGSSQPAFSAISTNITRWYLAGDLSGSSGLTAGNAAVLNNTGGAAITLSVEL